MSTILRVAAEAAEDLIRPSRAQSEAIWHLTRSSTPTRTHSRLIQSFNSFPGLESTGRALRAAILVDQPAAATETRHPSFLVKRFIYQSGQWGLTADL